MEDKVKATTPKLESEVQTALRFERIERTLDTLSKDLKLNTDSTKELVEAWNSSKWVVALIKGIAILVGAIAAVKLAISSWGH